MEIISYADLVARKACQSQLKLFTATFGDSAKLTASNVAKATEAGLDVIWLTGLLSAPALAEYEKATAQALAEYDKARVQALAEYSKATAQALVEHDKATARLWAEYLKVEVQLWAEYREVEAPARAAYKKVEVPALLKALKGS